MILREGIGIEREGGRAYLCYHYYDQRAKKRWSERVREATAEEQAAFDAPHGSIVERGADTRTPGGERERTARAGVE